jgi:hypothetical protein
LELVRLLGWEDELWAMVPGEMCAKYTSQAWFSKLLFFNFSIIIVIYHILDILPHKFMQESVEMSFLICYFTNDLWGLWRRLSRVSSPWMRDIVSRSFWFSVNSLSPISGRSARLFARSSMDLIQFARFEAHKWLLSVNGMKFCQKMM